MSTRVLIVDDHPVVREGLAARIGGQEGMEVVGEAVDCAEAMLLVAAHRPDVVVVDIQLKTSDGLDLVRRIRDHDDSIGILVWSVHPEEYYAQRALNAGALGYVNKEQNTHQIIAAIERVARGKIALSDEMAQTILGQAVGTHQSLHSSPIASLSDRELQVFRLIGEGLTAAQMAEQLHLSRHTIDTHRQRIKRKLGLRSAAAVTQAAIRWLLDGK